MVPQPPCMKNAPSPPQAFPSTNSPIEKTLRLAQKCMFQKISGRDQFNTTLFDSHHFVYTEKSREDVKATNTPPPLLLTWRENFVFSAGPNFKAFCSTSGFISGTCWSYIVFAAAWASGLDISTTATSSEKNHTPNPSPVPQGNAANDTVALSDKINTKWISICCLDLGPGSQHLPLG